MSLYNCIIVGNGISALQLANEMKNDSRILIITKSMKRSSNSYRAQGGISAAIGSEDTSVSHFTDTIVAGCHFHNEAEVQELVENGSSLIQSLIRKGVQFDTDSIGQLSLGLEGAHSLKRIVHCGGDTTGKHVVENLIASLEENVEIIENRFVYELIVHPLTKSCIGVKAKDQFGHNETYYGDHIVLATGGIGGLYSFTSNDPTVTGDGIALAYRAGAEVKDMEFIQFHPTLLYINGKTEGLISEAVRGEGAKLVNEYGSLIMKGVHPQEDLAPRHIVAKEMFQRRVVGRDVYLDISMISRFEHKFPTITALCQANGVSLENGKLPVATGCHFLMGGIAVDSIGKTSVEGLYAIGETACTGVHGANRLASNSLLEALHYGEKLAAYLNGLSKMNRKQPVHRDSTTRLPSIYGTLPEIDDLREEMMAKAGIIRTKTELQQLANWLERFDLPCLTDLHLDDRSIAQIQRLFMLQVAKLITTGALLRTESRGAHNREDYPDEDEQWAKLHIVQSKIGIEMRERKHEYNQVEIHA
ncbi:MAG: L-aspartate oxidase [Sporosarcina sp.]